MKPEETAEAPSPTPSLTPGMAKAAIEFMGRATLHASEIQAFLHLRAALESIASRE